MKSLKQKKVIYSLIADNRSKVMTVMDKGKGISAVLKPLFVVLVIGVLIGGSYFIESSTAPDVKSNAFIASTQNIGAEHKLHGAPDFKQLDYGTELTKGDVLKTSDSSISAQFFSNVTVRLDKNTEVLIEELLNSDNPEIVLKVINGRVWVNNALNNAKVTFKDGSFQIISEKAIFDMLTDGTDVSVYADTHDIEVLIVDESGEVIQNFPLAEGQNVDLYKDRINFEKYSELFYSKLIKELDISLVNESDVLKDPWTSSNRDLDKEFLSDYSYDFNQPITTKYSYLIDIPVFSQVNSYLLKVKETFILSKEKEWGMWKDVLDAEFGAVNVLLLRGQKEEADEKFKEVTARIGEVIENGFRLEVLKWAYSNYSDLSFVLPKDKLYPAKEFLKDYLLGLNVSKSTDFSDKLNIVHSEFNEVLDLLRDNEINLAKSKYREFTADFEGLLKGNNSYVQEFSEELFNETVLIYALINRYPYFYETVYFEIISLIDELRLEGIEDADLIREENQTIVDTKIKILNRVKKALEEDNKYVDINSAKDLIYSLIVEIRDYIPEEQEVAVIAFFEDEISEFGDFLDFLSTPEYLNRDGTFSENYAAFIEDRGVEGDVAALFEEISLLDTVDILSFEQVEEIISGDFELAGIENYEISEQEFFGDEREVRIISAEIEGLEFEGYYNFDSKIIYNFVIDGQEFLTGVKVENFRSYVRSTSVDEDIYQIEVVRPTAEDGATEEISEVDKVSLSLAIRELEGSSIDLNEGSISILDLSRDLYDVRDVVFSGEVPEGLDEVIMSFVYEKDSPGSVFDLLVDTPIGLLDIQYSINLDILMEEMQKIMDANGDFPGVVKVGISR